METSEIKLIVIKAAIMLVFFTACIISTESGAQAQWRARYASFVGSTPATDVQEIANVQEAATAQETANG